MADVNSLLMQALGGIASSLTNLGGIATVFSTAMNVATASTAKAAEGASSFGAVVGSALGTAGGQPVAAANNAAVGKTVDGVTIGSGEETKNVDKTSKLDGVTDALGGLVSGLGGTAAAFASLVTIATQFAGALNPPLMSQFSTAIKDLQATIGVAFLPFLEMGKEVARSAGELLLPVMRQLQPAMATLAETLGSVVIAEVQALGSVLVALIPVFEALNVVVQSYADFQRMAIAVIEGVAAGLKSILGGVDGGMKSAMESVREGFQWVLKAALTMYAYVAKLFGGDAGKAMIEGMTRSLRGQGEREGNAALRPAENATFKSAQDYGKSIALAAATSGMGASTQKSQEEWLSTLADKLDEIKNKDTDLKTVIHDAVKMVWDEIKNTVGGNAFDTVNHPLGGNPASYGALDFAADVVDSGGWIRQGWKNITK